LSSRHIEKKVAKEDSLSTHYFTSVVLRMANVGDITGICGVE
jgi:hypothetical protein